MVNFFKFLTVLALVVGTSLAAPVKSCDGDGDNDGSDSGNDNDSGSDYGSDNGSDNGGGNSSDNGSDDGSGYGSDNGNYGAYTGDATYFGPGLGACGQVNSDYDLIAAVSYKLFDSYPGATVNPNNNPICGKTVTAEVNGNSVTVAIVDRCAGCEGEGDLDFAPAAFEKLAALPVGRVHGMTWSFD